MTLPFLVPAFAAELRLKRICPGCRQNQLVTIELKQRVVEGKSCGANTLARLEWRVTWGRVSLVRLPRTQEILPDIVDLGALTELTGMVSLKRQGLQFTKVSLWGTKELNKKAFQAGIKAAKVYLKARDQRA